MQILILMFLCHVLDDFVLQPICLAKLKQRITWQEDKEGRKEKYKNDYKCALLIHSLSWSGWILIPVIFLLSISEWLLGILWIINTIIHYKVDNWKANRFKINLWTDQIIHFLQLIITYLIITW